MSIETLGLLLLAGTLGAVFLHYNRLNQAARQAARNYCEQQNLQLLDQSAILCGLRWVQGDGPVLRRRYRFEFSVTGGRRYSGWVELKGFKPLRVQTQPVREEEYH